MLLKGRNLTKKNNMVLYIPFKKGEIIMENNKFRQLCGKINYNTYNNIENALGLSGIGLILTNDLLTQQYPMLSNPIDVIIWTIIATNFAMSLSHGKNYTKDIIKIRELYQEFIKNYNKLNKVFDLSNPIQIYTMFNYLLYKGYLSKDKEFQFSGKQAIDINCLIGTNVITGQAVCRHISAMLTDILNDYGIESSQLGVYSIGYNININILDKPKYTKEELINWVRTHIIDEETYDYVMKLIEKLVDENNQSIEFSSEKIDDKNPLKRKFGNHAISFAFRDGKSYFLDPTQTRIYRMSESDKNLLYDDEGELLIRTLSSLLLNNNSKNYLKMKEHLASQYPSVSKEEEKLMVEKTMKLCNGNSDIFENFYAENSELYDDISSKVLRIRKNPFTFLK